MSLSAHEQHALDGIADGLAQSDPRLASLLATFNRLTSGEAMPASEKDAVVRRVRFGRARWLYARLGFQRIALTTWLALGIVLVLVALLASHGGNRRPCGGSQSTACASHVFVHPVRPAQKSVSSRAFHYSWFI